MLRKVLATLAFGIVTVGVGQAATLTPGGTATPTSIAFPGGTLELFTGATVSSGTAFTATYNIQIISDPSNALCANCLDFVYQVANSATLSTDALTSYAVGNFNSVATSVFFSPSVIGTVIPSSVTRSSDGGTIDFLFGSPITPGATSDFMIVETNVAPGSFAAGFTTIKGTGTDTATGLGATAVSPEPASFVLLGSGLLGLAGAAKRKFAKA